METRTEQIRLVLTKEEKAAIEARAKASRLQTAVWARNTLLDAAEQ